METLKDQLLQLWNNALLAYRTMVIKAELKRRRAIENSQDRKNELGTNSIQLGHDNNPGESHKYGHINCIADDVNDPAGATNTSKTQNCKNRSEINRVFDLFDTNRDGLICADELKLYMKRLGFELSDQNVKDILATVDSDRDDGVDFEEFCSLYGSLWGKGGESSSCNDDFPNAREHDLDQEEDDLLKAFFIFDRNKDGLICALELQQVLLKLGVAEGKSLLGCQKMIERVDTDGNGKVDFFEFKDMMCSNAFSFCSHTIDISRSGSDNSLKHKTKIDMES